MTRPPTPSLRRDERESGGAGVSRTCEGTLNRVRHLVSSILILASCVGLPRQVCRASDSPAQRTISELDGARTRKEWKLAQEKLGMLGPEAESDLRQFAADTKRDGQKRFYALRAAIHHLPINRQKDEVRNAFKQDHDPRFRIHLAFELGRLKDEKLDDDLRSTLRDKNEHGGVQLAAAWALAVRGDSSGKTRALAAVIAGEEWRDFGMQTLAILRANDVIPTLENEIQATDDYWRKNNCRLAKLRIQTAGQTPPKQLDLLKDAMKEEGFFEVRAWAAKQMAEIGTPEAGKELASFAKGTNPSLKRAAVTGLNIGIERNRWTRETVEKWLKD